MMNLGVEVLMARSLLIHVPRMSHSKIILNTKINYYYF